MERGKSALSAVEEVRENFAIPVVAVATLEDLVAYLADGPELAANPTQSRHIGNSMGFPRAERVLAGFAQHRRAGGLVRHAGGAAVRRRSIYCCDVGGQPVCGDIPPAACYGRAYREMSPRAPCAARSRRR